MQGAMQKQGAQSGNRDSRTPMSGFVNGEAVFLNKFADRVVYPCGSPNHEAVGTEGGVRTMRFVSKPLAQFRNHMYSTRDPEIARGLISDDGFGHEHAWMLDDAVLPEEVRKLYSAVPIPVRQKISLGAVDGMTGAEMRALITPDDLKAAAVARPGSTGWVVQCPHEGCGLEIKGDLHKGKMTQDAARKMMETHINSTHPNQKIVK